MVKVVCMGLGGKGSKKSVVFLYWGDFFGQTGSITNFIPLNLGKKIEI